MRCTSSVSWSTARLLRLILHLLRVEPFASYKSFYSESSRSSSASHHLQRVIIDNKPFIFSKSSSITSHSSSASHHRQQVTCHLQAMPSPTPFQVIPSSTRYLTLRWKGSWTRSSARNRSRLALPPHFLYQTSLQFQIQLPVFVLFSQPIIKTRVKRRQVPSNEL